MTKPKITIHNLATNEIIERDLNAEELAAYEADQLALENQAAEKLAKENARKAILDKLGITLEEAQLLLS